MIFRHSTTIWFKKDLSEEGQRLNGFDEFKVNFSY